MDDANYDYAWHTVVDFFKWINNSHDNDNLETDVDRMATSFLNFFEAVEADSLPANQKVLILRKFDSIPNF